MTAVEFKELKVNDRVKTLHSGMATVVKVGCYGGTMVKLDCDIKKWDCPYFYESELDFGKQDTKQETLHEVALEFAKDFHEMYETSNLGSMHFGFIEGAKWQQERMYSEEDMREAFEWGVAHITFEEWIKQFKNK